MIPKTIHYCWFSSDRKPSQIQRCIDSWRRVLPDYEIKCWGPNSFDFDSVPYVKEAISIKKYAFAADYVRLYALYTEGGIYLDSDVEVYKSFNDMLDDRFFSGSELYYDNYRISFDIEAAIIGSEPGHPLLKDCMRELENKSFLLPDGSFNKQIETMPLMMARIAKNYGYSPENKKQLLREGIVIYPAEVFPNTMAGDKYLNDNTVARHCNASSWCPMEDKGKFFHFCRDHNMIDFYRWIEKARLKLTFKRK